MSTNNGYKETLTETGNTKWRTFVGPVVVKIKGNLGGGAVQLQERDPDGIVEDVENGALAVGSDTVFDYSPGAHTDLRLALTGAAGADARLTIQADYYS